MDHDVTAVCPRCLREMDDDVEANIECIEGECDTATPEDVTRPIIASCCQCGNSRPFASEDAATLAGWDQMEDGDWVCWDCALADAF